MMPFLHSLPTMFRADLTSQRCSSRTTGRTSHTALQTGAVNEDAQEVVAELNRSLAEQPTATAALLEQPARPASPVVPPPEMSLGSQPVVKNQ